MLPKFFPSLPSCFSSRMLKFLFCLSVLLCFTSQNLEGFYQVLYNITDNGGITFTGNTLGLSKQTDELNPGTDDSIGCYITTDTAKKLNNYPFGTTALVSENSSSAVLDLPPGSTILHAELIWSGSYGFHEGDPTPPPAPPPANDVTVTLKDPLGVTHDVQANPSTAQESNDPSAPIFPGEGNYVRTADVTSIVASAGAGTYTAGNIEGTLVPTENLRNAAGWTLAVVYRNPNMYTSNLTIWSACEQASDAAKVPAEASGFCAPPSGVITSRLFVSATEGDATRTGDHMLFGPSPALFYPSNALSGSNNPANNFFASQINTLLPLAPDANGKLVSHQSGQLDTRGTFGTSNANAHTGTNIVAGRQGFDITSIDVSSLIATNQNQAFAAGITSGFDDYAITALGLQVQVDAPILKAEKLVNGFKSFNVNLGSVANFSITIQNTGTSPANNVVFHDILPAGLNFVAGSVTIDGNPDLGANPSSIPLPDLAVNASTTIAFNATVDALPVPGCSYSNFATINYDFTPCFHAQPLSLAANSDTVTLTLLQNGPFIQPPQKSVSPTQAAVGDTVTYTFTLQNIGDTNATSVVIADSLPAGLAFISGSLKINGNPTSFDPSNIPVGNLNINGPATLVTFDVIVAAPPAQCTYLNSATITYHYQGCNGADIQNHFQTNQTSFTVGTTGAQLQTAKTADRQNIFIGDVITYTITILNTGNDAALQVNLQDTIPAGLSFVADSVTINGNPSPGSDPNAGFQLPDIGKNETATITFQANVVGIPASGCQYINQATISYHTSLCADQDPTHSILTNEVKTNLNQLGAKITAEKRTDHTEAALHDVLTFSFILNNVGDLTATDFIFKDVLPSGLTFVEDSFTYNFVPFAVTDPSSVLLPDLDANDTAFVSFQVTVDQLPEGCTYENSATIDYQYISCNGTTPQQTANTNTVTISIEKSDANIVATKLVDSEESATAHVGDIVTFTFLLENTGDLPASNVILIDNLPSSLSFLPGTFKLNGTTVSPDPNLAQGFFVGMLAPHQTAEIEFQALVNSFPATGDTLENFATVNFQTIRCDGSTVPNSTETETVTIELLGEPDILASKLVNTLEFIDVSIGQIVTFTISLQNTGDAPANSVIFQDTLDQGLVFVPGSFSINGNLVIPDPDIASGVPIGTIKPGQFVFIEFQVQVVAFPSSGEDYFNLATIDYHSPDGEDHSTETNEVDLHLLPPTPRHFHGTVQKCKFLNETEYLLKMTWDPARSPNVLFYRITRNGIVIGQIDHSDRLVFKYRVESIENLGIIEITAVYAGDFESAPIKLRTKHD